MNSDTMKGKWSEVKGEVINKWGKLTSDELEATEGNITAIAGLIQQRYGEAKEAISETLSSMFSSGKEKASDAAEELGQQASNATEEAKDALRNTDPSEPNLN